LVNAIVNFAIWRKQSSKTASPGGQHGVILQDDNAGPHTANITKAVVQEFNYWEILLHPPYSPDFAPLHRITTSSALSNNLRGVSFNNDAEIQNCLDEFLMAKPADFFKCGTEYLPERWEVVVNNGGEYIID
jgi:hypothetical protein